MSYTSHIHFTQANYTFPSVSGNESSISTFTVQGVRLGDYVLVSFDHDCQELILNAYVSANDTIKIIAHNHKGTTITLPTGTLYLRITKHQ